ncbi:uncharacterized protein [Diabrotica undecimpunctata]|uniref:uncharacterized protein n=1 Tax=Diabrotica undecimpunctata TaxID=50387 RepID=UPI003B640F6C
MSGRKEDSSVILFINLVKARQCIWNYSLTAYSRTDVMSTAWSEIASEIKDTEKNCRERWKNIRTAYVRSVKPPKSGASQNSTKSYYLAEHLAFLQPYFKGGETSGNLTHVQDTAVEESYTNQNDGSETIIEEKIPDEASSEQLIEKRAHTNSKQTYKKRKGIYQVDDAFIEWLKTKKSVNKNNQDGEQHFLLSLLPDLKNLSLRRKRTFKIQTMSLLHKLLEEDERENVESSISVASSPSVWSLSSHHDTE